MFFELFDERGTSVSRSDFINSIKDVMLNLKAPYSTHYQIFIFRPGL